MLEKFDLGQNQSELYLGTKEVYNLNFTTNFQEMKCYCTVQSFE